MIFVRVFFVTVVLAAFVALGYAFWLTFQPLDAPPVSEGPDDEQMDQGPPPPTPAPPAAAGGASAMDDRPHQSAVIDQLRRPVHAAREVTAEARRIGTRIEQALPPEEDRNLEHA